jgi:predicted DNA-binding transcriptional regulator YafY
MRGPAGAILMLLQRHGRLTARQLASTLEVSVRTIYPEWRP